MFVWFERKSREKHIKFRPETPEGKGPHVKHWRRQPEDIEPIFNKYGGGMQSDLTQFRIGSRDGRVLVHTVETFRLKQQTSKF